MGEANTDGQAEQEGRRERAAFNYYHMGYASAMARVLFGIILVLRSWSSGPRRCGFTMRGRNGSEWSRIDIGGCLLYPSTQFQSERTGER